MSTSGCNKDTRRFDRQERTRLAKSLVHCWVEAPREARGALFEDIDVVRRALCRRLRTRDTILGVRADELKSVPIEVAERLPIEHEKLAPLRRAHRGVALLTLS